MSGFFRRFARGLGLSARDRVMLDLLTESLNEIAGGWALQGDAVQGPGPFAIRLTDHHEVSPKHFCLAFTLGPDRPDVRIIRDCVTGIGSAEAEVIASAVHIWTTSTAPALMELVDRRGRFADHYHGDDPDGFAGWRTFHGPIFGWGSGSTQDALQAWVLANPLLPHLRNAIEPHLDRSVPNGVKLFLGGTDGSRVAEVRINGEAVEQPSRVLSELGWPQPSEHAYLRIFVVLTPEDEAAPQHVAGASESGGATAC